jgi:hypothetical protein
VPGRGAALDGKALEALEALEAMKALEAVRV